MPTKRRSVDFGAVTDDPKKIANAAEREYAEARNDGLKRREAAEKAWLAACAVADVAAHRLGMPPPAGRSSRELALEEVERLARLKTRSLLSRFKDVHDVLHGECFYGDACPRDFSVWIDTAKGLVEDTLTALDACRPKRRRRR